MKRQPLRYTLFPYTTLFRSTVTGKNRGLEISLEIGNVEALVNGNLVVLDVPAKVINGRILVPVRFIAESTGAKVNWDPDRKSTRLNSSHVRISYAVFCLKKK